MYTLKQINQHVQHPQIGDVWIHSETFDEIRVTETTRIDKYWRKAVSNYCYPQFLAGEKFATPVPGEIYESVDERIEILRVFGDSIIVKWTKNWGDECLPDINTYEKTFTQEEWDTIVRVPYPKGLGFKLTEEKPESEIPEFPTSGVFDFTKHSLTYRAAFICTNGLNKSYIDGKTDTNFNSTEELRCWIDSLNHSEIQEFGDYPEKDSFNVQDAYGLKFRISYTETDKIIVFRDGETINRTFTNNDDFACWLHSMRRI